MNRRDFALVLLPVGAVVAAAALAAAALASSAALAAPTVAPAPAAQAADIAHEAFQTRRYAEAYGRYAQLADAGDAGAAWMALLMVSNGPTLFGREWSATPGQLRRWSALATRHAQERSALIPVHDRGE